MRSISRLCSGHQSKTWVSNGRFCGLNCFKLMRVRFWLITYLTSRYRSKSCQKVWSIRYKSISIDRSSISRARFLQKYSKESYMLMQLLTPQWSIVRELTLWLVSCTWFTKMNRNRSLSWNTWSSSTRWATCSIQTLNFYDRNSTSLTESSQSACQICTATSK